MCQILCTICVRKNSKGIKNKNFRKFLNTTLVDYTIVQAKKIEFFDKIVLSTDANKNNIKKINKVDFIINRPKKLSNDFVSKIETIKESYFPSETKKSIQQDEEQEETFEVLTESMDIYSSALNRSTQR